MRTIQYSGTRDARWHLPHVSRINGAWMCRLDKAFIGFFLHDDRAAFGTSPNMAYRMWLHSNPAHAVRASAATAELRGEDAKWTVPLPPEARADSVCSEPYAVSF